MALEETATDGTTRCSEAALVVEGSTAALEASEAKALQDAEGAVAVQEPRPVELEVAEETGFYSLDSSRWETSCT